MGGERAALVQLREALEDVDRHKRLFSAADPEGTAARLAVLEEEEGRLLAALVTTGSSKD